MIKIILHHPKYHVFQLCNAVALLKVRASYNYNTQASDGENNFNSKTLCMYLNLNREDVAGEIQKNFTALYPFLKIEFHNPARSNQLKYPANEMQQKGKWFLQIRDNMTVSDLENSIMDHFGLTARVYRRSGNMWLKTTVTENLTLRQQNDHGREITEQIAKHK